MKTLLLLRHGKAEEASSDGDHARVLKKRGRNDAAEMGRQLRARGLAPDLIVTSDASRAEQTARIAAEAAGFSRELELEPDIYAASLDTLLAIVRGLPDDADRVMLVGHNPGFEDAAAALAAEGTSPPRLPTCGLAHLEFDVSKWAGAKPGTGRLVGVYTPE